MKRELAMSKERMVSVVSPVFNEEATISEFVARVFAVFKKTEYNFEMIIVNDGSTDRTIEILEASKNVIILQNDRNFGQQLSIIKGLKAAKGDAVVVMDADLQDPPEMIMELLSAWEAGADAVMAKRSSRTDTLFKKITAFMYYRMIMLFYPKVISDAGEFYLLDRSIVNKLNRAEQKSYFLRGLIPYLARNLSVIYFKREARSGGESGYNLRKMLGLALMGLRLRRDLHQFEE